MLALKGRKDYFKILLPKEFICPEIEEKYTKILASKNSFFYSPIEFLNETIQRVEVFGFTEATWIQQQGSRGEPMINPNRTKQNDFLFPGSEHRYRSDMSPISLVDKTLNIEFRHTLGYINYFMLFVNFWYQYTRDRSNDDFNYNFNIDIMNENGKVYSRIVLNQPYINSMDMLSFDFTQPVAASVSFKLEFKYNNFDYQFIEIEDDPVKFKGD